MAIGKKKKILMILKGTLRYPTLSLLRVFISRLLPLLLACPDSSAYISAPQTSGTQEWVVGSLLCPLLPLQPGGNGHSGN